MNAEVIVQGFGNGAALRLDGAAARTSIFAASSVLLKLPGGEDPNRELVLKLAEPVSGNGASCRAEKALKSIHDIMLREYDSEVDIDLPAGAFLFVIHRALSSYFHIGTPAYPIYIVASTLRLHRPQVWEVASELARMASVDEVSNGYSKSLTTCLTAFKDFWGRLDQEVVLEPGLTADA